LLPQTCSNAYSSNLFLSGSLSTRSISINQNTAALYFYSDSVTALNGFSISWTTASSTPAPPSCLTSLGYSNLVKNCGSNQTGLAGLIQSPNYPNAYNNNANCVWNINAPAGNYITLSITSLWLEPCCDFLFVLSPQTCSNFVTNNKRLTGRTAPNIITVPQNSVQLVFISDSSVVYPGFEISWTAAPSCAANLTSFYNSLAGISPQVGVP
jgi:hypothetical protein